MPPLRTRSGRRGIFDARYLAFLGTIPQIRPKLLRYCARMTGSVLDGEDVVQDALFHAYRKLDTFDDARPLGPWLFRIAHNRCIDLLRRRGVREEAEAEAAAPDAVAPVDPPGPALGRAVEHLVLGLPPMERACVLLKDVFDYSLEDIAPLVDSTVGGVKAALSRGRGKLAAAPARMPPRKPRTPEIEQLLRLYVERFNQQDWDGLRTLIAADARLRVADAFSGPLSASPYFGRWAAVRVPVADGRRRGRRRARRDHPAAPRRSMDAEVGRAARADRRPRLTHRRLRAHHLAARRRRQRRALVAASAALGRLRRAKAVSRRRRAP